MCLLVLTYAGCSSVGPRTTPSSSRPAWTKTPEMTLAFGAAEKAYVDNDFLQAESLYRSYIKDFSFNALTPKAYFRLGELRLREKDYENAWVLYRKSTEKYMDPEWGTNAVYKQAVCASKSGRENQVFGILDQIPWHSSDASPFDGKLGVRIGSLRVAAGRSTGNVLQEEKGYLELVDAYAVIDPSEARAGELSWIVSQNTARQELETWVKGDSPSPSSEVKEVSSWLERFDGKTSGGYALWRLARLGFQRGDYAIAAEKARSYLERYPRHPYREDAQNLLIDLKKRGEAGASLDASFSGGAGSSIGVLLPLSGKYAVYGESVLHGLECGAGIFSPCHGEEGVQLVIRDTKGDPQVASAYLDEFAANPSIRAVIGPLPQVEIEAAAQAADRHQIPMISLSQKAGVADLGEYVFRNFLTAEDQVMTLVDYACHTERLRKFAILYPEGAVGDEYQKLFKEAVADCGGKVLASESYPENTRSFTDKVRSLISGSEGLSAEVRAPFQALFIPDVYRRVPPVIDALNMLNIKGVRLLGGAGWDHPGLLSGKPEALEGAIFVDGFVMPSGQDGNFETKDFAGTFQSAYGVDPTILEAYAFDTVKLVGTVLREHPGVDRTQIRQLLLDKKNFPGVTGSISFDDTGDARRRLSVLQIVDGEIKVVSH